MKNNVLKTVIACTFLAFAVNASAWIGMSTPMLHVEGRNLKDPHGNTVNLHGFAQTYSPWFNEQGTKWTDYNVAGCLSYNKDLIDKILAAGWKVNFMRLHMDPYWSNTPGQNVTGENDISAFDFTRFKTYLDQVFIPMAEYAISKGLYVVMRPPGVCPEKIAVNDDYNKYLLKVWGYVSQHAKLRNNPGIMFELANEPINILGTDGTYGAGTQGHFDNLKQYFQAVVDTIRAKGCQNVLWVPGLGYQSLYKGYAVNPIEGKNIGYAVHIYPGWFGSGSGYENFQKGWDDDVKPVANIAPICVTEMDWAPAKYQASWGKDSTGVAGGMGFGANFKKITDESKNVSWLLFTEPWRLAQFTGTPPATGDTCVFLNDPQACPLPCFNWYNNYSQVNYPRPDYTYQSTSDNGDGTYTNPVVFGDFPDPDVIRVGDVYYMSTTNMHTFPGATILKSHDLVNWEYCCNPLEKIESTACYNLEGCNVYGHGQWASSLKYHNGKYYLHFNTLEDGSYLLTATNPEGPWTKKKLSSSFYDAGLFFDEDGKTYIVHGINNLHIAELDSDFNVVKDQAITLGNVQSGIDNTGTEGSHLYKINGYYYIYSTTGGYYATQVAYRSSSIWGLYDEKEVLNSDRIHQGALIQTQTGEWWTMLFGDKGAYGRLPYLLPVTWTDNWPMVSAVTTHTKPDVGKVFPKTELSTNDNFCDYKIAKQWGWNHNPDNSKWSLVKRPGYLRLYTANVTDSLTRAKNTLTQRILGYPSNSYNSYGTTKMHISNLNNGDVAGLCVFQDPYAYIGVKMVNGQKVITMLNNGVEQTGPVVTDSVIYLRALANYSTSKATFYYSLDNSTYIPFGSTLDMKYDLSVFMGNRFCLFNYATLALGGYVDFDWFSTEKDFTEQSFFDDSFTGFSETQLTLSGLTTEKNNINLITGNAKNFTITAAYLDGHTEDATLSATYTNSNPNAVTVKNGQLIAKANGNATITATYQGAMGEAKTVQFEVNSSYFPLTGDVVNPSIFSTGTFDETTHTLTTGLYGFGGWIYNSDINLSAYKYLIVKLGNANTCNAIFKLYDENNYWTTPAEYPFGSNQQIVVKLDSMYKYGTTTKVDPSHIYIAGIWSTSCPLILSDVYVTNNSDYSKPDPDGAYKVAELKSDTTNLNLFVGNSKNLAITAVYVDGHAQDVTSTATYSSSNSDIATVVNGQLIAKANGSATITASYQGSKGDAKSIQINVISSYFPLTSDLFNPSIYASGTYDEATQTLTTGLYGFGGWNYSSGMNLSGYKYLVAKLANVNTCGATFKLYDENNYWTNPAEYPIGSNQQIVIKLNSMYKYGTTTKVDPSHIYIAGIWSFGCPLILSDVYVTNHSDYSKPDPDEAYKVTELKTDTTRLNFFVGGTKNINITAVYGDGHTQDVTSVATYSSTNPDIATVVSGQLITQANGSATITATYQGTKGDAKSIQINVYSSYFPLTSDLFNPSIYASGTYDEATQTLTTGLYGFGGWNYSSGMNLSGYKYLVAKLANANTCGATFKLYDENNYWTNPAEYPFGSNQQIVIKLDSMYKYGTTTKVDPSHIYIAGIWSFGCPLIISDVYVTNNLNYTKSALLEDELSPTTHEAILNEIEIVDVYTILGIRIKSHVLRKDATQGLPSGLYLVGNKKTLVTRNY